MEYLFKIALLEKLPLAASINNDKHKIMRLITFLTASILTLQTQVKANIHYIDFSKISKDNNLKTQFDKVKDNVQYYNNWTPEWKHETSKEELVTLLEHSYSEFLKIKSSQTELYLLLGTISHYLYNLDQTEYHKSAIENFDFAVANNQKEYRAYWFLGFHYALSNNPKEAIENLLVAKSLLPKDEPIDFWENFAFATSIANMPSHSIYAMDKARAVKGEMGYFESQLGDNIRKRVKKVDRNESYKKEDIWSAIEGDMMTFICRPLGLKILVDSTWNSSIYDHKNGQSAFLIKPTPLKNKQGRDITYTIAILMQTADSNDNLDSYLNNFVSKYSNKTKVKLTDKYDKMIAFEIKDNTMYKDIGGGHLYMVGIERNTPKYPGLLLESPVSIPKGKSEKLTYYRASESKDRFEGKIFYLIMLDSCEDIHEKSFAIFKEFLDKFLVIE